MAYKQEFWDEAERKGGRLGEKTGFMICTKKGRENRSRKQSGKERINSKPQHLSHWFRCYFFALFQEEGEEN